MSETSAVPFNFLGLEPNLSGFDTARILVWPVPFERTVSYGRGTGDGPHAIIDASRYVETYDEEIDAEASRLGIHTLPAFEADRGVDEMMLALKEHTRELLASGKFLCTLGGEHSITSPVVGAFAEKYSNLSVLQIDAHADLRDSYEGSRHSHACAMRRVLEFCPAVQVGIRALSIEEARAIPSLRTKVFYAKDIIGRTDWIEPAVEALSENVYITLDIDGLDPSIAPATGTPEPGGFTWYEVVALLRAVAMKRRVVGMDLVEVSGSPANLTGFVAAKLIYKTLSYIFREEAIGASGGQ